MLSKLCKKCNNTKPVTEFFVAKQCHLGVRPSCKDCMKSYHKDYYKSNVDRYASLHKEIRQRKLAEDKDYDRKNHLRAKFNISLDEYNKLLEQQHNCCAICSKHKNKFSKNFAVDHDHKTGKVRGLLCQNCNTAVGKLFDDPNLCKIAEHYLRSSNGN